ncbi:MAG: contractile injection system protein, VgrG/Pvc8 family [Pseudomonadota bacterium]|nr:contractile injection system protein, VgrG/Pvc8 family [Pseudomonadota bacterium]
MSLLDSAQLPVRRRLNAATLALLSQDRRDIQLLGTPVPVLVDRMIGLEGNSVLQREHLYPQQRQQALDTAQQQHELSALSRCYVGIDDFIVQFYCAETRLDPDAWLGRGLTLHWRCDGQRVSSQSRHLDVQSIQQLDHDGALSLYSIRLSVPWVRLTEQQQSRIFSQTSSIDIVSQVLQQYGIRWQVYAQATTPIRRMTQWQETDWQFVCRVLAEDGLFILAQHDQAATHATSISPAAFHSSIDGGEPPPSATLLIVDDQGLQQLQQQHDLGTIQFGVSSQAVRADRIQDWVSQSHSSSALIQRGRWSPFAVKGQIEQYPVAAAFGSDLAASINLAHLIDDDGSGMTLADQADAAQQQQHSQLLAQYQSWQQQTHLAIGAVRDLSPLSQFQLRGHASADAAYRVLQVQHYAANNLSQLQQDHPRFAHRATGHGMIEAGSYRQRILAVPADLIINSAPMLRPTLPPMTARVASVADRDHRHQIEIPSFSAAVQGDQAQTHAGIDQPVRRCEWIAGSQYGTQFAAEIGDEVLIHCIEHADHLVILGSLPNQHAPLLYPPQDQQAQISGYRYRTGAGQIDWATVHTPQQVKVQLAVQQQGKVSQLTLGQLNPQVEGLQLSTNQQGVIRTGQALHLSSQPSSWVQSQQQHDRLQHSPSLYSQSLGAINLHERLSQLAQQLEHQITPATEIKQTLTDAQQAQADAAFTQHTVPHLLLDSGRDTVLHAPEQLHLHAGGMAIFSGQAGIAQTAQGMLSSSAVEQYSLVANQALSITNSTQDLRLAAHTGQLKLQAAQNIEVSASDGGIEITAQDQITLQAGGATIELKGSNITITARQYTSKGSQQKWSAGAGGGVSLQSLPKATLSVTNSRLANINQMSLSQILPKSVLSRATGALNSISTQVGGNLSGTLSKYVNNLSNTLQNTPFSSLKDTLKHSVKGEQIIKQLGTDIGNTLAAATKTQLLSLTENLPLGEIGQEFLNELDLVALAKNPDSIKQQGRDLGNRLGNQFAGATKTKLLSLTENLPLGEIGQEFLSEIDLMALAKNPDSIKQLGRDLGNRLGNDMIGDATEYLGALTQDLPFADLAQDLLGQISGADLLSNPDALQQLEDGFKRTFSNTAGDYAAAVLPASVLSTLPPMTAESLQDLTRQAVNHVAGVESLTSKQALSQLGQAIGADVQNRITALVAASAPNSPIAQNLNHNQNTEVSQIKLSSPLYDGSGHDGTGQTIKKALKFGEEYHFEVTSYTGAPPPSNTQFNWLIRYRSPATSKNRVIDKLISTLEPSIDLKFTDPDLCGCEVLIYASIGPDPLQGGHVKLIAHTRFRWFDAKVIKQQIQERKVRPWRVDQGGTSLCGMAVVIYAMIKQDRHYYEKFAFELYRTGQFNIGNSLIKPHPSAESMYEMDPRSSLYKRHKIFEVDWITLATVRSAHSGTLGMLVYDGIETSQLDMLEAVNWPDLVADLCKKLGRYRSVTAVRMRYAQIMIQKGHIGRAHDQNHPDDDLRLLADMQAAYEKGHTVLMLIDSGMLSGVASYDVGRLTTHLHWIGFEGNLRFIDAQGGILQKKKFQIGGNSTNPPPTNNTSMNSVLSPLVVEGYEFEKISKVAFRVYTWGYNPATSVKYEYPLKNASRLETKLGVLSSSGVDKKIISANLLGYLELIP